MDPAAAMELAARSGLAAVEEAAAGGHSDIQRFYSGSVVFVTGGTGFMGKQLTEKLLRSCKLSKMYLLMRSKKEKSIEQRLTEMLQEPVYDNLRKQQPDFARKIVPIQGDVAEIRLGMSDTDWETVTEEVDVIFHMAATTRFDEALRVATLINVRGTREALILGKDCKKLRSFVHVSTAYSHATSKLIDEEVLEEFYASPIPPEVLISMAESLEDERLLNITTNLIKDWPNTYTFAKAVAEELVRTRSHGLPICIVRPGIVICSYREPAPGWVDVCNIHGATGFVFGIGLGVLHTFRVNGNANVGLVPCDFVNNAIIAAGRETATSQAKGGNDTKIYTVSSPARNPVTWNDLHNILEKDCIHYPTPNAVYHTFAVKTKYKTLFTLFSLLLQIIPAYIGDFICLLIGKERRFAKLAKKVYRMSNTLSFFMLNDWEFVDNNLETLYTGLSENDKTIFNFDVTAIDWREYTIIWCIGIRKYIIKDSLQDTEYAKKKQFWLRIVHYIVFPIYLYGLWKALCVAFCVVSSVVQVVINCYQLL